MSNTAALAPVLSQSDILHLAEVIQGCQRTAKVKWAVDGDVCCVQEGSLRYIERTNYVTGERAASEDLRDQFVRITTRSGMECWLPVAQILSLQAEGLFCFQS